MTPLIIFVPLIYIVCTAIPHQRLKPVKKKKSTAKEFTYTSIDATPGQNGVRANPGKSGGKGGAPGRLRLDVEASFNKHFSLLTRGGKGGKGGTGGEGGAGGKGGNIKVLQTVYTREWIQIDSATFKDGVKFADLKTDLTYEEKWAGQEANGEIGEMGENGKDGRENKSESKIECTNIAEKQINQLSNIRAHYTTQLIGETLDNLVNTEINLTDRSMYVYQIKQNSLREDLEKYINELSLVNDKISQFNAGSLKYVVENFRGKLLLDEKKLSQGSEKAKKDMREMAVRTVLPYLPDIPPLSQKL